MLAPTRVFEKKIYLIKHPTISVSSYYGTMHELGRKREWGQKQIDEADMVMLRTMSKGR